MDEPLTMSHEDIDRLRVIRNVLDKTVTQVAAADMLDLSARQVKRLCAAVRKLMTKIGL